MATHSSVLAWRIPEMGGVGWAAVYGTAQSRTRLKRLSSSSGSIQWNTNSATEKNKIMPFAAMYIQSEIILLSEVSRKEEDITFLCGICDMTQMNLSTKQSQTDLWSPSGRGLEEGWSGRLVSKCKLLHTERINNKVLLYSTGNYIWYPMINQGFPCG